MTVLPGTVGSMTNFPSGRRGIGVQRPNHLDLVDAWTPIEENGFSMVADFHRDRIDLEFYVWNHKTQSVSDIPALELKHRATLRPAA